MTELIARYSLVGYSTVVTDELLFPSSNFKRQLNLPSTGIDDDTWLYDAIGSAREFCERNVNGGLAIRYQTRKLTLNKFPTDDEYIELLYPPLVSISEFQYYDGSNTSITYASSDYRLFNPGNGQPAFIVPNVDETWSETRDRFDAVNITFFCGSTAVDNLPKTVVHAIKMLVAYWYENRSAVLVGSISKELEFSLQRLLGSNEYGYYG